MIVPLFLRIAACRALLGATTAGDAVHDSAIAALDDMVIDTPQPFIVVSVDEQTYNVTGLDVGQGDRNVDLIIDVAVGSSVKLDDGTIAMMIPHSDAGTELAVNLIVHQVMRTLFEPSSGGEWGKIFRRIAMKVSRILVRRGAGAQKGVRFSASQIIISLMPLAEPEFGKQPEFVWADFIATMRNDPGVAPLADGIVSVIVGVAVPDWRQLASAIGLNDETAEAIGIMPLGGADSQPISEVTVDPDGWLLNAEQVDAQLPDGGGGDD